MTDTRTTALHDIHTQLGAHFTDFGGWDMPLRYGSELTEHRAVREHAGLFDLSHMGEIWVEGPDAATYLNTALVGNLAAVAVGRAKYTLLCAEDGGIIDDLITYRITETQFLVVPNAGNAEAVAAALGARAEGFNVSVTDASATTSLLAVQGPAAAAIVASLVPAEAQDALEQLPYYAHLRTTAAGLDVLVARTGYTGEDGFELYLPNNDAPTLWNALAAAGEPFGLIPAGLACRDSLRLEAGMPLYGNELTLDTDPFTAGLGGVVSFKKAEEFVGRSALEALRDTPGTQVLVGLRGAGRRAGRGGYPVYAGERLIGAVTSGQLSPTLGEPIALAVLDRDCAETGTTVEIDVRGTRLSYTVVPLPFYRRDATVAGA